MARSFLLEFYRSRIDRLDSAIISLLEKREKFCRKLATVKRRLGLPIEDAEREVEVLKRAARYSAVFEEIVNECKKVQRDEMVGAPTSQRSERVGVIGAGEMGRMLALIFSSSSLEVGLYDSVPERADAAARALEAKRFNKLEELADSCDVIAVAVPSSVALSLLNELKKIFSSRERGCSMIFDVVSFKRGVIDSYRDFPVWVKTATIHPLFGPRAIDPWSMLFAVCPIPGREDDAIYVVRFLKSLGLRVVTLDWEKHDELFSLTISASYATALAILLELSARLRLLLPIETTNATFEYLLPYLGSVLGEKTELLEELLSSLESRRAVLSLADRLRAVAEDPASIVAEAKSLEGRMDLGCQGRACNEFIYDSLELSR
ncbi:MAG: prephenate dehydrogenase/arogenate dehydrogenase family protein [Fervidicoccaceae archaeon]